MIHSARQFSFKDLYNKLQFAHSGRLIKKHIGAEGLELYCYNELCAYDRKWDEITLIARGLIVDTINSCVVATPFPKFFNYLERPDSLPNLPFEVFEKLDGSLVILFWHNGRWKCSTKGSLSSEQAKWAEKWIQNSDLSHLVIGTTYLAEAIYPENRIVVNYPYSGLFLLGGYYKDGAELSYHTLEKLAKAIKWRIVERHHYSDLSELLSLCSLLSSDREGFVIRFANGHRIKMKGDEYCRVHRLISHVTPLAIWEMMWKDDNLEAIRKELPEEFWIDFDSIINTLGQKITTIQNSVELTAGIFKDYSDKQLGLSLETIPEHIRSFIFPYRKNNGELLKGRSRDMIFRAIRPTGNLLGGYIPSSSMNRIQQENG